MAPGKRDIRICIIGLGLIGGSLAKALKEKLGLNRIAAVDSSSQSLDSAIRDKIIDIGILAEAEAEGCISAQDPCIPFSAANGTGQPANGTEQPANGTGQPAAGGCFDEIISCSDIIFICTPHKISLEYLRLMHGKTKPACIVTDTGSTKLEMMKYTASLNYLDNSFIGGHPMTGSEKSGYSGSYAHLFENAYYLLTPPPAEPASAANDRDDNSAYANTNVNADANTNVNTDANTNVNTDANTNVNTDANTNVNADANTNVNADADDSNSSSSSSIIKDDNEDSGIPDGSDRISILKSIITGIGAIPIVMDAAAHDRAMAAISHIPHIIASALVNLVSDNETRDGQLRMLAAGGFRDITRIASSEPRLWEGITSSNAVFIGELIDSYILLLKKFKEGLNAHDSTALENFFDSARNYRDTIPAGGQGAIGPSCDIVANVADKPGIIGEIATLLGRQNINIKNIGISNSRENEYGCLKLTLPDQKSVKLAIDLLTKYGYKVSS